MIYIVFFIFTTFLIYLSENYYKRRKKHFGILFAIVAVLSLSIFAGMRDVTIGTDVRYYLVGHFENAGLYSGRFWDYMTYMVTFQESELLYVALQYIGKNFFDSINFVMFIIALITNTFIYLGLKITGKDISVPAGWLLYCLLFFNIFLNILRQSCAIAIVWFLTMAYSEKKYRSEIIWYYY